MNLISFYSAIIRGRERAKMPRHKNDYGYWENVDRLPIPGCGCQKCCNAADRQSSRRQGRQSGQERQLLEVCTDCASNGNGACIECNGEGTKTGADGIKKDFCLPCNGTGVCRVCKGSGFRPITK